jgi:hypothetical protein
MIKFERITNYILDILSIPPGELPYRVNGKWDEVLKVAVSLDIYYPIAAWILKSYDNEIPHSLRDRLIYDLKANEVRNVLHANHIIKIADLFEKNNIPFMILKGGAALVMDIFPAGWRYMSDIDILLRKNQACEASDLLQHHEYVPVKGAVSRAHQLRELQHPDCSGEVDLHLDPYPCLHLHGEEAMPSIWENAVRYEFLGKTITIPSCTDHAWVLMRRKLLSQPLLPRLCDVIELALLTKKGAEIDMDYLHRLAQNENLSNIISGMSYACSKYGGMEPFASMEDEHLRRWHAWSLELRKKFIYKIRLESPRLRFVVVYFISPKGFVPKLRFCLWLNKLIGHIDRFDCEIPKAPSSLFRLYRLTKFVGTFIFSVLEYCFYSLIK